VSEYLYTNEDGSTTKYTEEMIKNVIIDRDYYRNQSTAYFNKYVNNREKVYEFFKDRYETGSDEITCDKDEVNELLDAIGAEQLKSLFTVKGSISFTLTDVEAESEEEAERIAESEVTMSFDGDGDLIDWDVEISDTSQQ
jgi:nicotinic acid phosphoribosyltransferase